MSAQTRERVKDRLRYRKQHEELLSRSHLALLDMERDAKAFGRYKTLKQMGKDFLSPLMGFVHLGKALLGFLGAACSFAVLSSISSIYHFVAISTRERNWFRNTFSTLCKAFVYGLANLLRGATLILAAGLIWSRALGKALMTGILGWKPFTENSSVQGLVKNTQKMIVNAQDHGASHGYVYGTDRKVKDVQYTLESKLRKAKLKGQKIDVDEREYLDCKVLAETHERNSGLNSRSDDNHQLQEDRVRLLSFFTKHPVPLSTAEKAVVKAEQAKSFTT